MSLAARDKTIFKINNKLKRNNLFGLGFVSLIAACGRSENISTPPETSELDEEAIQAIIDAAVKAAILKTRNDAAQAAEKAEADRIAEEATYTPTSARTTKIGEDHYSSINILWSKTGYTTTLPFPKATYSQDKSSASIYNLGGDATKADLLVNLPTFDGEYCSIEGRGLVAVYWDIQYGFDLDSKHLRIFGASGHDEIGDEGVSLYSIGGVANSLDMVILSGLADNGATRADAGAIYIIWDIDQYSDASKIIYLSTDHGSGSGILAIKGGYGNNHIGQGDVKIATVNNDEKLDLILEAPDTAGGKGGLFIFWDIAKAEYRDGKNIDLHGSTAGVFKIYGKSAENNLGQDGRGFIFRKSETNKQSTLKDFDSKGTHDFIFYDGYHTYLLLGEKLGSNSSKAIDLGSGQVSVAATFRTTAKDSSSAYPGQDIAVNQIELSGSYGAAGFRIDKQYTNVDAFYNDMVNITYGNSNVNLIHQAHNVANGNSGTPFGPSNDKAADKEFRPISEASTSASSVALSDMQEDGIWDIA